MIKRIGWIIGTVLVLFLMVTYAGTAQEKVEQSPDVSTEKWEAIANFPDFQRKITTRKTSTYEYEISTILTKSEQVNQNLQRWIEKETENFLALVEGAKQNPHEQQPAQLLITAEIETVTDEIHSLTFSVSNKEIQGRDVFKIFNLDLNNHKILALKDILELNESNIEGFSSIFNEHSVNDHESRLSEWLESSIKNPDQLNWKINQNVLTLFLDDQDGQNHLEIPLEKLTEYFTDYTKDLQQLIPPESTVRNLDPAEKYIALTFDDGPSPQVTPRILETLKQHGAKATFFMLGSRVQYYPELAKQVAAEGHEIGNHTGSHPNLSKLNEEQIKQEIVGASQIIEEVIGLSPAYFRPPYGVYNPIVEKVAFEHNSPIVLWSVDSLDWKNRNPEGVNQLVKDTISPGSIVLLHDIHSSTADALPLLMTELKKEGYQFVTVTELLSLQEINGNGPYYGVAY
ncbi:polysaccharide deacetylase family protein [Bacillus tuaregi]|uniref:polysaccharide deacetylase family protein n=1 Tax=Bacillus tuaregi TaxID=1816695 RepID=UPI000AF5DDA3|nr:polysaccharide deacetylase family protein [Bacillus tuaregi]